MALTPQQIAATRFKTVKRNGYDPGEVDTFKQDAATALESALQQATAMEARARAAVAKVQELSQAAAAPAQAEPGTEPAPTAARAEPVAAVAESETISRTLLLAQRTADVTIAEAEREAEVARQEAAARAEAIIEAAKVESRQAGEEERVRVEGEVQALLARRDFLQSDVEHLEQHIDAQRERITEVVAELEQLTNRVPNGLAVMRRPQLSASDHAPAAPSGALAEVGEGTVEDGDDDLDVATLIDEVAAADDGGVE